MGAILSAVPALLAIAVVIGGGVELFMADSQVVQTLLSNAIMIVLGYYFGSSSNSRAKTETIANLAASQSTVGDNYKGP